MYNAARASQQYRQTQVMTTDPLQLLIMTYDYAIAGCHERNLEKVTVALKELRSALNHEEGGQIAADLLSLYLYMADEVRKGHFEHVATLLQELRDTWVAVREQMLQPTPAMAASLAA